MTQQDIISNVNIYLHTATTELCEWLNDMLPRITDDWWQNCVLDNLSITQRNIAVEKGYSSLEELDLSALLRVADKSWYAMRSFAFLPTRDRECVREMIKVRNNWAHIGGTISDKDVVVHDLETISDFLENVLEKGQYAKDITEFKESVEKTDFLTTAPEIPDTQPVVTTDISNDDEIHERDQVYFVGDPDTRGMVFSVTEVEGTKKYEVFVNGEIKIFYDGQIVKVDSAPSYRWVDIATLQTSLTAYEINNPSSSNLYSLNSARIDFVPYQFRPALKMIKADEPRILIADSVGVGKTIEAGLLIKELEARSELENVLIICPKPLVAERKWELEMKRFDEEFVPLNGSLLRQAVSDAHRDEEWPTRYSKAIIPYSILDSRVYESRKDNLNMRGGYGLLDLDPAPHFDLVIIDEAHHIRNGSMDKEKAFAYKCVRYFCEHADAVVMLTATPLQTSDDNLYTLMNLLRPDVVIDKDVFTMMSLPNEFVYNCSHAIRGAGENWQEVAIQELQNIKTTQWGESVIARNPLFEDILNRLKKDEITREERVQLISDVESLHSFNTMLNRTRRKDIQDFCIRRSYTVETQFTEQQKELHNELLHFEYEAFSKLYHIRMIPFLMSTIRRQASSCIFGLAPHIRDMINRRFSQLTDDIDFDIDEFDLNESTASTLLTMAHHVLEMADNLPEEDTKFDSILTIINEKQKQDNNKVILFSSFRHTLNYLDKKLKDLEYRVAQINGSVSDEDRRALRERFELPKDNPNALDMLLFTEVGSEGLDYQFCDTMINYDLPWNPMRIEQRIGRIDRRGQQSEYVSIYNIITADTVDADIYDRCLSRIGIFERSIGECEEVLGSIGAQIEQIALNTSLTPEERRKKLEQMADNEVRRMQELNRLEDEERALFGFDLSNYTAAKEIKDAESPWISPMGIQRLVERYLNDRLGEGQYIVGVSELKQLRLSRDARALLLEDFKKLSNIKTELKRKWEGYLKGTDPMHMITFVPETAAKENKAFFITPMHPLVKQAAAYFATSQLSYICLDYVTDDLPEGEYRFSIYTWSYRGINPMFKVVPVCENSLVEEELTNIIEEANAVIPKVELNKNSWDVLESKHISAWQSEKDKYLERIQNVANYKLESLGSNYRSRKRTLERKIAESSDEKIVRMYQSELETATIRYESKVKEIQERATNADIHTALIANGVVEVRRG